MSKWRQISIGEFVNFNPTEKIEKGKLVKKIPMAMLTEFERKIKGFELSHYQSGPKFRNGDTLVAKITPCLENGKTAQVDILEKNEVAFGSSEFIVLRENENSINDYIFYLAKSPVFRERAISCMEGTSGRKRVNEGALKRQTIIVPDKPTQQKIAFILSALDDKIELNNKINAELEAMAKTIYDYWFVQFDFPDKKGKPYKSSGGKMVYNGVLKREAPEGCEVKRIDYYADIIDPHPSHRAPKEIEKGFPFAGIGDVDEFGNIDLNKARVIDEEFVLKQEKDYLINEYSIGYGRVGTVGRVVKLRKQKFRYALSPTMAIINPKENGVPAFVYYTVKNPIFFEWVKKYTSGSTRPAIGIQHLRTIPVINPQPSSQVIKRFESYAGNLLKKSDILNKQNQQLSQLRDWLLPMLMNGQVTVGKAYEQVAEVLSLAAEE